MGGSEHDKHGTHDQHNVHGDPEGNVEADTASGGAPDGSGKPITTETLFTFTKVNLVTQFDALRYLQVDVRVITLPQELPAG